MTHVKVKENTIPAGTPCIILDINTKTGECDILDHRYTSKDNDLFELRHPYPSKEMMSARNIAIDKLVRHGLSYHMLFVKLKSPEDAHLWWALAIT